MTVRKMIECNLCNNQESMQNPEMIKTMHSVLMGGGKFLIDSVPLDESKVHICTSCVDGIVEAASIVHVPKTTK